MNQLRQKKYLTFQILEAQYRVNEAKRNLEELSKSDPLFASQTIHKTLIDLNAAEQVKNALARVRTHCFEDLQEERFTEWSKTIREAAKDVSFDNYCFLQATATVLEERLEKIPIE